LDSRVDAWVSGGLRKFYISLLFLPNFPFVPLSPVPCLPETIVNYWLKEDIYALKSSSRKKVLSNHVTDW